MEVEFLEPTEELISAVIADLRVEDKREVLREGSPSVDFAVRNSIATSTFSMILKIDGEIVGAYGIVRDSLLAPSAVLWGLSTNAVNRHKLGYLKVTKLFIEMISIACPDIEFFHNFVDGAYKGAIRWAAWFGARFNGTPCHGRHGGLFYHFILPNRYHTEVL